MCHAQTCKVDGINFYYIAVCSTENKNEFFSNNESIKSIVIIVFNPYSSYMNWRSCIITLLCTRMEPKKTPFLFFKLMTNFQMFIQCLTMCRVYFNKCFVAKAKKKTNETHILVIKWSHIFRLFLNSFICIMYTTYIFGTFCPYLNKFYLSLIFLW